MTSSSITNQLQSVEGLRTEITYNAVPELARLDRRATGWGCIFLITLFGLCAFAVVLIALYALLIWWLAIVVQLLRTFLFQLSPTTGKLWLVAIMVLSVFLVVFSPRWHSLMRTPDLWKKAEVQGAMSYVHLIGSIPSRVGMSLLAGSFLPFTLFALSFPLIRWHSFWQWFRSWVLSFVPSDWAFILPWIPYALLVLGALVLVDWSQRVPRTGLIITLLTAWGLMGGYFAISWLVSEFPPPGFFDLSLQNLWPMSSEVAESEIVGLSSLPGNLFILGAALSWRGLYELMSTSWPFAAISIYLFLGLAYPVGVSYWLARVYYLPYAIFRNTLDFTLDRSLLRIRIAEVLRSHLEQNKERLADDSWRAVCATDLQRFIELRAKRSYFRAASFYHCPVCKRDMDTLNHVDCISVRLDKGMSETVEQNERVLWLNGLHWIDESVQTVQAPFESIVISHASDYDIELFVAYCQQSPKLKESLQRATCHILEGYLPEENTLRMLQHSVWQLNASLPADSGTLPCPAGLRQREAGKRYARQWARILLILLAIVISSYLTVRLAINYWPF